MKISLVSTVFNDQQGVIAFFEAIEIQTSKPDEVVVVDAGSTDGTWEVLKDQQNKTSNRDFKVIALQEVRCNVARGRDLAIEAAAGDVIVSTDIGCEWRPKWLEELVTPFYKDPDLELVIGSWVVRKEKLRGKWALTEWALKGDRKLEADADSYSSSRSIAYKKDVWEALGRYPEDLTLAADDAVFHFLIEKAEVNRVGSPKINCYWHRHETLRGFLREQFRYGLGDGESQIRLRDLVLIGGRLAFETVGLISGSALLFTSGFTFWALLTAAAVSIVLRIAKLFSARSRLQNENVKWPLLHLVAFTYSTKIYWIWGYAKGLLRGWHACRDCRSRLKKMTPELFRSRLREQRSPDSVAVN